MNQTGPLTPDNFICPIRTLVVDDSAVLLRGLCEYLRERPLFQLVGTAASGSEALQMAEMLTPDLVLMDLRMPDMDGLEVTAVLRRHMPNIRIIIMTMEDSVTAETRVRADGAHGFIFKPQIRKCLMAEVRRVFHWDDAKDEVTSS